MTVTNHEDQYDWDNPTTSGLLDEYVATIIGSEFAIDADYNAETVRLALDLQIVSHDDPGSEKQPGDTLEEAYNVGDTSTWEIVEGGRKITRVDGSKARLHANSGYGNLVNRAVPGKANSMDGADKLVGVLRERGSAYDASIWEGLTFKFKRLDFSFKTKEGEEVSYQRVYPVEFIGVDADAGSSSKAASASTSSEAADIDRDAVVALAAEHDEYNEFLAAAMTTFPGIESSDLADEVMDAEDGIFAEAHK